MDTGTRHRRAAIYSSMIREGRTPISSTCARRRTGTEIPLAFRDAQRGGGAQAVNGAGLRREYRAVPPGGGRGGAGDRRVGAGGGRCRRTVDPPALPVGHPSFFLNLRTLNVRMATPKTAQGDGLWPRAPPDRSPSGRFPARSPGSSGAGSGR